MDHLSPHRIQQFQQLIRGFYAQNARPMPWRNPDMKGLYDPYAILVSEMMLQQTQVSRVVPKYLQFIKLFPDMNTLAQAELATVLQAWSGLGYNRRAKFLWQAAREIVSRFDGAIPSSVEALQVLPGIGPNTAAAIIAYAYDRPVVFVETNIRTVLLHEFFPHEQAVSDKEILAVARQVLPPDGARQWYYGLMDYGAYLKATVGNVSQRAKAYSKQNAFKGSLRQLRGEILRQLLNGPISIIDLEKTLKDERLHGVCDGLIREGLVHLHKDAYVIG